MWNKLENLDIVSPSLMMLQDILGYCSYKNWMLNFRVN